LRQRVDTAPIDADPIALCASIERCVSLKETKRNMSFEEALGKGQATNSGAAYEDRLAERHDGFWSSSLVALVLAPSKRFTRKPDKNKEEVQLNVLQ
jgi:hypothetical protein